MRELTPPGRYLLAGPSAETNLRRMAAALRTYVKAHGSEAVVVLEFGPDVDVEGRTIGPRLDHRLDLPPGAWTGVVDMSAPRVQAEMRADRERLARENERLARFVLEDMPIDPAAAFVNAATVPYLAPDADPDHLLDRLEDIDYVVMSAYEPEETGQDGMAVSEQRVLDRFRSWCDEEISGPA